MITLFRHATISGVRLMRLSFGKEAHLEAAIIDHPELLCLDEGTRPPEILQLEQGVRIEDNRRGRIDIVAYYPDEDAIAIIETKKNHANRQALGQTRNRSIFLTCISNAQAGR